MCLCTSSSSDPSLRQRSTGNSLSKSAGSIFESSMPVHIWRKIVLLLWVKYRQSKYYTTFLQMGPTERSSTGNECICFWLVNWLSADLVPSQSWSSPSDVLPMPWSQFPRWECRYKGMMHLQWISSQNATGGFPAWCTRCLHRWKVCISCVPHWQVQLGTSVW